MIFGETPLREAENAILAHSLKAGATRLKKGRRLSQEDLAALKAAGIESIVAARLEPGDIHEDDAAARVAEAVLGSGERGGQDGLSASAAFTGRCNLIAQHRGVLAIDRGRLDQLNLVDEAVTVASLPPYDLIEPRQMAATIKIIPFAVPERVLQACVAVAEQGNKPLISLAPLTPRKVGLVQTKLPGLKPGLLDKTREAVNARLASLDCPPAEEQRCDHRPKDVSAAVMSLLDRDCRMVLVSGASAIVDRRDVVPAGIVAAGGEIRHFGMPVDPGNLLLTAEVGEIPVLGLPGCARSPKLNGFDWVLQRLLCDLPVTPQDVMGMGAGGLLKEIAARPLPRAAAVEQIEDETVVEAPRAPRIAVMVLAAGRSTRMGSANKLLAEVDGAPMVRHAVRTACASQGGPVIVVTGHEAEAVADALHGESIELVHNPDFAEGLSTSLRRGLAALPEEADGVLVCLGDMPGVDAGVLDRLIAAFSPLEGRAICLPTWKGKRGNPVLLGRRFFPEIQALTGDVGAKPLVADYPELVAEVPMPDDAVLTDIDTPDALARRRSAG